MELIILWPVRIVQKPKELFRDHLVVLLSVSVDLHSKHVPNHPAMPTDTYRPSSP
jgi:hypothetical protein